MAPLNRKAIGMNTAIGAESAILPKIGIANNVPIIAPVSTSLYNVLTRSSDSIIPVSTKLVIQSIRYIEYKIVTSLVTMTPMKHRGYLTSLIMSFTTLDVKYFTLSRLLMAKQLSVDLLVLEGTLSVDL